jgi:hypothetical protein
MMREKSSYSFLRTLVKGQDYKKDLTGIFCTVGGTLVTSVYIGKNFLNLLQNHQANLDQTCLSDSNHPCMKGFQLC